MTDCFKCDDAQSDSSLVKRNTQRIAVLLVRCSVSVERFVVQLMSGRSMNF